MKHVNAVLDAHPDPAGSNGDAARACIDACHECAAACTACADACLHESPVEPLTGCIRFNVDCADVCGVTARLLARAGHADAATLRLQLRACEQACRSCADECETHAAHGMEHCRACAIACGECARACEHMTAALVP